LQYAEYAEYRRVTIILYIILHIAAYIHLESLPPGINMYVHV